MRFLTLDMVNVGPFDEASLDFRVTPGDGDSDAAPVTFVTGVNGTGKSIIIDAIRAVFGFQYTGPMRSIARDDRESSVAALLHDGASQRLFALRGSLRGSLLPSAPSFDLQTAPLTRGWVVDYWESSLDAESFAITTLTAPLHQDFLINALSGKHSNPKTTQLICHFDYLRDSEDPEEKRHGELLYDAFQRIAEVSLPGGRFAHVARSRLEPMFTQRGQLLGISKLAAGSQYWMTRMLGLLGRMYSCYLQSASKPPSLLETPGLLLIDEAENHLHPQWQKRFLPIVQKIFPNLQLIVATHSPFILASVRDARVYVCRAEDQRCVVDDVTDTYADRPIDEILMSPALAETRPFSEEITKLLEERKQAIIDGDSEERERIEHALLSHNREYFDYFHAAEVLGEVAGQGEP